MLKNWLEGIRKEMFILMFIGCMGFILLIVGLCIWFFLDAPDSFSNIGEKLVGLGSFLGGVVTPWLTFLGLLALLYTIRIQSKELALSRKELVESREELAKTAEAQVISAQVSAAAAILDSVGKTYNRGKKEGEFYYRNLSSKLDIQKLMDDLDKNYDVLNKYRKGSE